MSALLSGSCHCAITAMDLPKSFIITADLSEKALHGRRFLFA